MNFLKRYLEKTEEPSSGAISCLAALDHLNAVHPQLCRAMIQELRDQRSTLKLIASENYSSLAVQQAMGNWLTDKYAEGVSGRRFYAGCDNIDTIETMASEEAKSLFGCDHAYVQPHSGADANLVAFLAILSQRVQDPEIFKLGKKTVNDLTDEEHERIRQLMVNQRLMGMSLSAGGHLTHGYRMNISSKLFHSSSYSVDPLTHRLDYSVIREQALRERPAILIAGYSAYTRLIDFSIMREIADEAGASLMVDMAHFSGLVAGKAMEGKYNPIPYAHIVTSTTHKTLRGPRGGIVLCTNELKEYVDKGCPHVLGGPLPHVMAAKAVAFKEANTKAFQTYAKQVIANAKALAEAFIQEGVTVITGGTDNHIVLINVAESFGINGRQAEVALRQARITVNRNMVPYDPQGAWYTSGVRLGTPALTTLGLKEEEMKHIAKLIGKLLRGTKALHDEKLGALSKSQLAIEPAVLAAVKGGVEEMLTGFPLYPELDVGDGIVLEKSTASRQ